MAWRPVGRAANGQKQTGLIMLDLLISPLACVGAIAGIALTGLLYWVGPADLDATHLGAWLVGLGFFAGLTWDLLAAKK